MYIMHIIVYSSNVVCQRIISNCQCVHKLTTHMVHTVRVYVYIYISVFMYVYILPGECVNQVRTIGSLYTNLFHLLRNCPGIEELQLPIVKEGFKYKEFSWAVSTVMSRQNKILMDANSKTYTPVLIPLWDFCNHSNGQVRCMLTCRPVVHGENVVSRSLSHITVFCFIPFNFCELLLFIVFRSPLNMTQQTVVVCVLHKIPSKMEKKS